MLIKVKKSEHISLSIDIDDKLIEEMIKEAKSDIESDYNASFKDGDLSYDKVKKIADWLFNGSDSDFNMDNITDFNKQIKSALTDEMRGYFCYKLGYDEDYSCGAFYDEFFNENSQKK